EGDVEHQRTGRDHRGDLGDAVAHAHDGALAELLLDLAQGGGQRALLVLVHGRVLRGVSDGKEGYRAAIARTATPRHQSNLNHPRRLPKQPMPRPAVGKPLRLPRGGRLTGWASPVRSTGLRWQSPGPAALRSARSPDCAAAAGCGPCRP